MSLVTVSQHTQLRDPETEAAEWKFSLTYFIIYTCSVPTVTCQNVFSEKGLYYAPDLHFLTQGIEMEVKLLEPPFGRTISVCVFFSAS